jgi:hypothetical protein
MDDTLKKDEYVLDFVKVLNDLGIEFVDYCVGLYPTVETEIMYPWVEIEVKHVPAFLYLIDDYDYKGDIVLQPRSHGLSFKTIRILPFHKSVSQGREAFKGLAEYLVS